MTTDPSTYSTRTASTWGPFAASAPGMPAAFGPDGLVLYWETDDLDVPTIVVKRLPAGVR